MRTPTLNAFPDVIVHRKYCNQTLLCVSVNEQKIICILYSTVRALYTCTSVNIKISMYLKYCNTFK